MCVLELFVIALPIRVEGNPSGDFRLHALASSVRSCFVLVNESMPWVEHAVYPTIAAFCGNAFWLKFGNAGNPVWLDLQSSGGL